MITALKNGSNEHALYIPAAECRCLCPEEVHVNNQEWKTSHTISSNYPINNSQIRFPAILVMYPYTF